MQSIVCPFCFKVHALTVPPYKCTTYDWASIPPEYVRDYEKIPPIPIFVTGPERSGKSTYIRALLMMLDQFTTRSKDISLRPLDEFTSHAIRGMRTEMMRGLLPKDTFPTLGNPLLLNIYNIPHGTARCLALYEGAGEFLDNVRTAHGWRFYLKHFRSSLFCISLEDLRPGSGFFKFFDLSSLFLLHLYETENPGIELEDRTLIVVYTQADNIELPADIRDYIENDPFQFQTNILDVTSERFWQDYISRMKEISNKLEDYTLKHVEGGAAFLYQAKGSGLSLAFSAVSALGHGPDRETNLMRVNVTPLRVLDPYLWALILEKEVKQPMLPQIFLSYAHTDSLEVNQLYRNLTVAKFHPWMDKHDILPGEKWETAIKKAIRASDFFLACLTSNSVNKRGMIQKEIKEALDIWQEKIEGDIYLIPVRLEACNLPDELSEFQWVDLFEVDGWDKLMKAIQVGMERRKI